MENTQNTIVVNGKVYVLQEAAPAPAATGFIEAQRVIDFAHRILEDLAWKTWPGRPGMHGLQCRWLKTSKKKGWQCLFRNQKDTCVALVLPTTSSWKLCSRRPRHWA